MRLVTFLIVCLFAGIVLVACGNGDDDGEAGAAATETTEDAESEEPSPTPEPTETPEPESTPTEEVEPTATAEATEEEEATPTAEPSPTPAEDDEAAGPAEHVVEMQDPYAFAPAEIEIASGDTIRFVNASSGVHTATLDPEIARDPANAVLPEGAETWDSGSMQPGDEFTVTLEVPGDYVYFCRPHESLDMVGTITVTGDGEEDGEDSDDSEESGDGSEDDDDVDIEDYN